MPPRQAPPLQAPPGLMPRGPSGGGGQGGNGGGPRGGGPRRGKRRPKKSNGLLTALLYLFTLILVVIGGGVGYLLVNPPSELIRETIQRQVKDKTGRDLVIAGDAGFSIWPGLGVRLKDVSLSGPAGSNATLVHMDELDVNIKTLPLINRQVELRRLIVRRPVFDLRVDRNGRKNWDFTELASPVRYAQAAGGGESINDAATPAAAGARRHILPQRLSEIEHLRLEDVRIEDGTVRYSDERSGKTQAISSINVKLALQSLQSPITASGDLGWKGERIAFNAKLTSARAILEEQPASLVFATQNRLLNSTFDGRLLVKEGADIEGNISANAASMRGIANWLGTALPPVSGFGPLVISGQVQTNGNVTRLSNATIGIDGATAKGSVVVTTGGVRPLVNANLNLSELDLNKYLTAAVTGGDGAGASGGAAGSAPALKPSQPPARPAGEAAPQPAPDDVDQIEQLLKKSGTKVYGYEQRDGWSSVPFNLELLGIVDADAKLHIGRLFFRDIKVGQSAVTLGIENRQLRATFDEVRLYDGNGKGFVTVDGTGGPAGIAANFTLSDVSALPLLGDAAGMSWLSGKANMGLQLAGKGMNQLQLIQSLTGKSAFKLSDGAISGFNLAGAIRGLGQGDLSALKTSPSEKTDFSALSATFNVTNGIARNDDLSLVGPLLRASGSGTVNLPQRSLDYLMKPKIVASLEGQGGKTGSGIEIPVRITGPWQKPKLTPDLNGVLSNPDQVVDTVKKLGKKFNSKKAKDLLNQFLGGD